MNLLSINDMAELSRLIGHLSFTEISRRLGKDYFTVNKACHRVTNGLFCQVDWHTCTDCNELISDPRRKTHLSCIKARNARRAREKRKQPHTKSTKYVRRYRIEHPARDIEQREKYKALLRSRWPDLPEETKKEKLDEVHQSDLRNQPLTVELANRSGTGWTDKDDAVVIKRIKDPAWDVAIELGRTMYSVRSRRVYLRKQGLIQAKAAEELDRLDNPEPVEKTYTVKQVSELLGLNPYHVRLLARNMKVGQRKGGGWRFTEADVEVLNNREGKRK
jgi:AraC-like DNA-binding protein